MEDEVRELFSRHMRKYLSVFWGSLYGKRELLVIFQGGCEKDLILNQLTVGTSEKSPMDEEPKVTTISVIPDETVDLEKGYYHGVYI